MRKVLNVILAALLAASACRERQGEKADRRPEKTEGALERKAEGPEKFLRIDPEMLRDLRITTAPVESRAGGEGVAVLGELRVDENLYAQVGPPIATRVLNLFALPGEVVRTGQKLAELQSVELGRARAEYLAAKARLELAEKTLERKRGLAAERVVAAREVQQAEADAASAGAQLRAAHAALQALGVSSTDLAAGSDASRFLLRSPISGTVIERAAVRGELTDPAQPLFRIGDLSRLWLTAHAYEREAIRVKTGSYARVTFPALPGRNFSGRVTLIGKEVDSGSRTIPVRIEIANEDGLLRPGMSATAWLPLGESSATIVAVAAASLQRMEEGWIVFLPRGRGTFEMRSVGRGRELDGEVEILSGLRSGETVVVDGAFLLKAEADKSRGEGERHDH